MFIADTDVLIDYLFGKGPAAERVYLELERGDLRTTVITRFELLCGARSDRQRKFAEELLEALPTLVLDRAAADTAAEIRQTLESRGEDIGMADCLIAGIVLRHEGILLTRNKKHFERVEGLHLATLDIRDSL